MTRGKKAHNAVLEDSKIFMFKYEHVMNCFMMKRTF